MSTNEDIGQAYAGAIERDENLALEAKYMPLATAPTSTGGSPSTTVQQTTDMEASGGETPFNMAAESVGRNIREIPLQFVFGTATGVKEAGSKVGIGDGEPVGREATTLAGGMSRAAGQFLPGFVATSAAIAALPESLAAVGLVALAAKARPVVAGIVGGTLGFDESDPRVSNLINEAGLGNPLTEWLAADPNDGKALGTFKSAIENAGLGGATEGILALARLNRARIVSKRALEAAGAKDPQIAADEALNAAREVLDPPVDRAAIAAGDPAGEAVQLTDDVAAQRLADAAARSDATAANVLPEVREPGVFYHGSGTVGLTADNLDAAMTKADNLFGQGVYLTDSRKISEGYAKARAKRGGTPVVYRAELGDNNLLDLESATPPGVAQVFRDAITALDEQYGGDVAERFTKAGLDDATPEEAYGFLSEEISDISHADRIPDYEFGEFLDQAVVDPLRRLGFDGFTHTGGIRTGKTPHRVAILFDPQDLGQVGRRPQIKSFDVAPPMTPAEIPAARQVPQRVYLNLARIDTPDDVKAAIDTLASRDVDAINAARGGETQTFEEVKRLADEMGLDVSTVLNRERGPMGAAEAVAARKLLTSSGEQLFAFARKAGSADATPADLAAFQKATAVHYALQTEVIAARTETARALASWRIPAPAGGDLRLSDVQQALSAAGGPDKVAEIARRMAMLDGNPAAAAVAVRQGFETGFSDAWKTLWFNGLLSSPRTHVANVTDNALTSLYAVPERAATALVDQAFGGGDVALGEADALFWGMMRGVRDGITAAGKALTKGESSDVFSKIEMQRPSGIRAETFGADPSRAFGHAINAIGKATDVPSRLLMSADEFFKAVNFRGELHAQAFRTARSEGLSGRDMAERMTEIIANPPSDMVEQAVKFGRTNTYTAPLGPIGQSIAKLREVTPGAYFIAPFVRTPANIMKFSFERTPLAPLSRQVRADIAAGGPRASAAWARIGLGSSVLMAAADMVANGEMVGGGPGNPEMRAARERMGIPQYAVRVGGEWVSFERLGFLGTILGLGADAAEMVGLAEFEDAEKTAANVGLLFVKSMANKSYLQGVFRAAAILADPNTDRPAAEFVKQIGATMVPFSGLSSSAARAFDPASRETRTAVGDTETGPLGFPSVEQMRGPLSDPSAVFVRELINRIRSRTPGLSDTLPPARDLWGRPKEYSSNLGVAYDFAIPFRVSDEKRDPVDETILNLGVNLRMPDRSIQTVPLTGEEYSEFVRLAGERAKNTLDDLVTKPYFKRLSDGPDGMKAETIRDVVLKTRAAARGEMLVKFPDLARRIRAQETIRRQLLVGEQAQ